MNYLKLIKSFWAYHRQELFTGNEAILYLRIVDLFSSDGEGDVWPETLRISDPALCSETGISPGTMDKFRKALVGRGLIEFQGTGKGYRSGGIYHLINTYSSPKRTSKRTSNSEELPERTLEIEELDAKEPQQVPQKEPQKEPQNLGNSHIYIESKQTNRETVNKNNTDDDAAIAASASSAEVELIVETSPLEEKKEEPQTPLPAPPLSPPDPPPKPAGSVAGKIRADCLAYNKTNPDLYSPEMYKAFIAYWTAPVQNATKKSDIGKELWQIQTTWLLAGRLANWHKRETQDEQQRNSTPGASTPGRKSADFLNNQRKREPAKNGYGDL